MSQSNREWDGGLLSVGYAPHQAHRELSSVRYQWVQNEIALCKINKAKVSIDRENRELSRIMNSYELSWIRLVQVNSSALAHLSSIACNELNFQVLKELTCSLLPTPFPLTPIHKH